MTHLKWMNLKTLKLQTWNIILIFKYSNPLKLTNLNLIFHVKTTFSFILDLCNHLNIQKFRPNFAVVHQNVITGCLKLVETH